MQPELWDPVSGERRPLKNFLTSDSGVTVRMEFAPAQSWFVVFRDKAGDPSPTARNFAVYRPIETLEGPWSVSFDPKWGGPAQPVEFANLQDWTTRNEPGIRYYSGTALYSKKFDFHGNTDAPLFLDLGTVRNLARVRLNGRDLGVLWCAPWGVRIPLGLLKQKDNSLEIEVTNVWANRMIGDEQEPPDCEWKPGYMGNGGYLKRFPDWFRKGVQRPSKGRYTFCTWNYFDKDSKLLSSGLLGPVRLMQEDWKQSDEPNK
jgi:hypothetical protein